MVYRFTWLTWLWRRLNYFVDDLQVYLVYLINKGIWQYFRGFTCLPGLHDYEGNWFFCIVFSLLVFWFTLLNENFDDFVDGLQVYLVCMILKEIRPLIIQYCRGWQVFKVYTVYMVYIAFIVYRLFRWYRNCCIRN